LTLRTGLDQERERVAEEPECVQNEQPSPVQQRQPASQPDSERAGGRKASQREPACQSARECHTALGPVPGKSGGGDTDWPGSTCTLCRPPLGPFPPWHHRTTRSTLDPFFASPPSPLSWPMTRRPLQPGACTCRHGWRTARHCCSVLLLPPPIDIFLSFRLPGPQSTCMGMESIV
jgi:hypothetical protein